MSASSALAAPAARSRPLGDRLLDGFHRVIGLVTLTFVLLPVAVVVSVSFTAGDSFVVPEEGLSLRWYGEFFSDPAWRRAFLNSAIIGVACSVIALMIGLPAAYAASRYTVRGRTMLEGLALSPLLLPSVAIGAAQYFLFARFQMSGTMAAIVIAHTVFVTPFVFIICGLGFSGIDPRLEQAAYSLGASGWVVFRRILMPNMYPSIVAAFLLCFISSFDELVITIFVGSGVDTVPLALFGELKYHLKPTIAALSVVLGLSTAGLAGLALLLVRSSNLRLGKLLE